MTARTGMANLLTRLRTMTKDRWQLYQETALGDGSNEIFWLQHSPQADGGTVSQGGTITGTASYTWDTSYGRIQFDSAPASNVTVAIEYRTSQFTDDELQDILDANATPIEFQRLTEMRDYVGGGTHETHRYKSPYMDLEEASSGTVYWSVKDSLGATQSTANYTADYVRGEIRFAADQEGTAYYLTARSYDLNAAAADVWTRKAAEFSDWYSFTADNQQMHRQQAFQQAEKMAKEFRSRAGANRQRGAVRSNAFLRTDLRPSPRAE